MTTAIERLRPGTDGGGLTFHAVHVAALRGSVGNGLEEWWWGHHDGRCAPLAVARWLGSLGPADLALVARCADPGLFSAHAGAAALRRVARRCRPVPPADAHAVPWAVRVGS